VYKVDNTYVYTIEGNTSSGDDVVIPNGGGVFAKKYRLTNGCILDYGRPKYDDYTYDDSFTVNTGIPSTTTPTISITELIPNAFTLSIKEVTPTSANISVLINTQPASSWSYKVVNLINNEEHSKKLSCTTVDNVGLDGLIPNTPYTLQVFAENGGLTVVKQIFFSTPIERPSTISSLRAVPANISNFDKFKLIFVRPTTWGAYTNYRAKGFRVSLLVNGRIIGYNDSLIKFSDKSTINVDMSVSDIVTDVSFDSTDTIQIGVQTWLKDYSNNLIFDRAYPVTTQPIYVKAHLCTIDKLFIDIDGTHKRAILTIKN
jgi:hypothetical protein